MNHAFFSAFADELAKIAAAKPPSTLAIWGPHLASAAAGAGLLLGAKRLYKDVQMGEQQRKMMSSQPQMGEM